MENADIPVKIADGRRYGHPGHYAAVGPQELLETAYRTDTPVTLAEPFDAEAARLEQED